MPSDRTAEREDDTLRQKMLLLGIFGTTSVAGLATLHLTGRTLPRTSLRDLVLLGLATNRMSRLLSKDKITRPVRAPFTKLEAEASDTVTEQPAGRGMRRVVGELLTCPRCTAMWSALVLTLAYAAAPRATRTVSTLLALAAVSDFANHCFACVK